MRKAGYWITILTIALGVSIVAQTCTMIEVKRLQDRVEALERDDRLQHQIDSLNEGLVEETRLREEDVEACWQTINNLEEQLRLHDCCEPYP
jgi:hypothetical protein